MKIKQLMCGLTLLLFTGCHYDVGEEPEIVISCPDRDLSYTQHVIPLLETYCISCHNENQSQGGINLEGYSEVIPYVNDGSLLGSIIHDPEYSPMPPNAGKLDSCDINQIAVWIKEGAEEN